MQTVILFTVSRLGTIREEHDANITYEGESNVLIQQASNWLLNQYYIILRGKSILSPLGSVNFLNDFKNILKLKFNYTTIDETIRPESKIKSLLFISYRKVVK